MKMVKVTFALKNGRTGKMVREIVVNSNNLPMGRARAQYELWRELGVRRFDYRMVGAAFVRERPMEMNAGIGTKDRKYELTDEVMEVSGRVLRRIRAVKSFGDVMKGQVGGWIESEGNLSHSGHAWVYGDAMVLGNAKVYDGARISDEARVYDDAEVFGNARVSGHAQVSDRARVSGNAVVTEEAWVMDDAMVFDCAKIHELAEVWDYAKVYGRAVVGGMAHISGGAKVWRDGDYATYTCEWSSFVQHLTYTRSDGMWLSSRCYGTGAELIDKAFRENAREGQCFKAIVKAQESIDKALVGAMKNGAAA